MGFVEKIEHFFLETVGEELCVFLCAMLPIIECRGAVPLGAVIGLPWWQTFLLAIVGNLLPVPFILIFIRSFLKWMTRSRIKFFNKIGNWLNEKVEKHKGKIEKYSYLGVLLFVALPVPGTGAWTGALIAALMNMRLKDALPSITLGVVTAGIIVTILSLLVPNILGF